MNLLERLFAGAHNALIHVRAYIVITGLLAFSVVLLTVALAGFLALVGLITPRDAGTAITEYFVFIVLAGIVIGLWHAHDTVKSRPTLAFLILMLLLGTSWITVSHAGELTEPVPAAELKVTTRGTGEDLQQALERARRQLPERALAVGVECIPEPDGLINCSYLYRLPKGDQVAPVSCRDFSPYNLCMHGNACYGEGAIIEQQSTKTVCQREGRTYFEAQNEYKRLSWVPLKEEK